MLQCLSAEVLQFLRVSVHLEVVSTDATEVLPDPSLSLSPPFSPFLLLPLCLSLFLCLWARSVPVLPGHQATQLQAGQGVGGHRDPRPGDARGQARGAQDRQPDDPQAHGGRREGA